MNIHDNIVDLMVPFSKRYYYCREMRSYYTIKYILLALFPDILALDYQNLDGVHQGDETMETLKRMTDTNPKELEKIRGYLLKYCELDTFAMVRIWKELVDVCK